ncbi:polysaccharide pyruvyl transferase family protein [Microbacterium sp. XT11]|uniref:polysaccharide pyruvyl transferase family protein n=1 Tax=Microbacterium sp. XT11 TaxID=367477 RepID=UPI000834B4C1|nr:polysaccharide pyruvyl transferase family protein [Microbacterium sp. XT11]
MRVLIAWANDSSVNLGVRALARGSEDLVRTVWPDAEFTHLNYGRRQPEVPWSPRALVRERVTGRLGMQRWLRGFDLIWDTRSGDSFADIYGLTRHTTMSLLHEFAQQAGVPVVMAPQTIGPFRTRRGRVLARRNLRRSRLVFARDVVSASASAELGRPVAAVTSDLVFGIDQPTPAAEKRDVLLNVSGLLWNDNPHVDAERYRASIRRIIDELLAGGRTVTLFPHVLDSQSHDNDVPVSRDLAAEYDGRVDLVVPADLEDARSIIAAGELVIGARMHACLNALSTGTPAVAMAYSRKFAPLMEAVGWDHVVSITEQGEWADAVLAHAAAPALREQAEKARDRGRALLEPLVAGLRTSL